MTWILLPRREVELLTNDLSLCHRLSKALDADPPVSTILEPNAHSPRYLSVLPLPTADCKLLSIWSVNEASSSRSLSSEPISCYWASPSDASITSMEQRDRAEIIHRTCQLATRAWAKAPYLDVWYYSRHGGVESVYAAAARRAIDLRITFESATCGERQILFIGAPYYAKRSPSQIQKPPDSAFLGIPASLEPPPKASFPQLQQPEPEEGSERGDLLIGQREVENKSLFALKYEEWVQPGGPLTSQQRRVVERPLDRPLRIHGTAGAGKTLVLILKTLRLLREAQKTGKTCHILFLVTSQAVQSSIRAAFDSIDDSALLASTKTDAQFLDLDTLHGWCIRELGAEIGGARVLERDPKASKERQLKLLGDVYQVVHDREFKRLKEFLSKDLVARVDGKREQLIRDMQREIAIRIKGRGFRRSDRDLYVRSPVKSFVGRRETEWDRHFIFHVYDLYEKRFHEERLLDTDDIALSMAMRLSTTMWDRQRLELGFDYVFVDETHLFNENERRLFPLLTRGTTEYPTIAMTFDEAQSIGGSRGDLESLGITGSEKRTLTVVHRSSPEIFALARDLVERSPLMFTEFGTSEAVPRMSDAELKRTQRPSFVRAAPGIGVADTSVHNAAALRTAGYDRIGVICFDLGIYSDLSASLREQFQNLAFEVEERGDRLAVVPRPGVYLMTPEACGGLEFDAVIIAGADQGIVPMPIGELSREGYLSTLEEAFKELYTAVTRARFVLRFIISPSRGPSELLLPAISSGILSESPAR